jgi:hypothetical protein
LANFPLPQDTVVIDNNSGAAGSTITIDAVYPADIRAGIGSLSAGSRTSTLTLSATSAPAIYVGGNWTNGSGLTLSLGCGLYFTKSSTLTSAGVQFSSSFEVGRVVNVATLTLADSLTLTGALTVSGGTVALGSTTSSVASYTQSSGTLSLGTGTLVINATPFQVSGGTVSGSGTVRMSSASSKTFAGNGLTYGTLQNAGAGSLTVSGNNTFTTISNSVQPTTFNFTSGSTQTVTNFNVSGTPGNLVTITATSTGAATLTKASGTVSVSYCSISKSTAAGGATWRALTSDGNVNGGSNTGWVFSAGGNGLFFGSNF